MVSIPHPKPQHLPLPPVAADAPAGFPLPHLPASIAAAITAVAARTQTPAALVAHHVLTLAAMAAQRLVDVRLPTGQQRPVSCFFVTAADAAERRDAAVALTLTAARAWEAEFDEAQRAAARAIHGPLATIGMARLSLFLDPKASGAADRYQNFTRASGLFAKHPDDVLRAGPSRHREAASLGRLWDGAVIARARIAHKLSPPAPPRLSLHLVGSPREIRGLFSDARLRDSGWPARLLLCRPASSIGARAWSAAEDESPPPEFKAVLASLAALYTAPVPAMRRVLALSPPAAAAWFAFAREVESKMGEGGAFASIRASAGLLPEHAARLAAVFAVIEDADVSEISEAALARGLGLARFYAAEAVRMFDFAPPKVSDAEKEEALKAWLARRPGETLRLREICKLAPSAIRTAGTAYILMRNLERAGVVEPANDATKGSEKGRLPRAKYQWRVVPDEEAAMPHDAA